MRNQPYRVGMLGFAGSTQPTGLDVSKRKKFATVLPTKQGVVNVIGYVSVLIVSLVVSTEILAANDGEGRAMEEKSTAAFRLTVNGRAVMSENDIVKIKDASQARLTVRENTTVLRMGQSAQIRVEVLNKNGVPMDVTMSKHIEYDSYSPWMLTVSKGGKVTAITAPGYEDTVRIAGTTGMSEIGVVYANKAQGRAVYEVILFRVIE